MAHILIVEDSPTQAERLGMILEDQNHSIELAMNGALALEYMKQSRFDLVITDIVMPGMSGYDLCKAIKAFPAELRPMVILLSTLGDPMDIIRGLECGADNYITKPYEATQLLNRITQVLENKRLRTAPRLDGGIDIAFMGQTFTITSEKEQVLDLLISTFEDILRTHRGMQESKNELAATNAIIDTTLQNLDHGVVVVDSDMRVSFVNSKTFRLLGIPNDELKVGMEVEIFMQRWLQQKQVPLERVSKELEYIRSREHLMMEVDLPNGRTLECRQAPLPYGGFVRTYTDVTEQQQFQNALQEAKDRAEEAVRTKASFLAAMSHEIRTPMNGVVGIVELLRSMSMEREQKEMVEIVHQSALSLLDVINDILDFSKIEAGKLRLEKVEISLAETIENAAEVVGAHTQSKYLDIICNVDPQVDSIVIGDQLRVRQIILNIMGNAVKFTEKGMVAVEVTVANKDDDSIEVLFEVTDTGVGIEGKALRRLFKPFSQADSSITRKYGGTGLGLTICKSLVELMGGEIGVRSEVGRGSTFWFKLPFQRLKNAAARDIYEKYNNVLGGLRIVVCDKIRSRSATAAYLASAGATVTHCDSIGATIRALLEQDAEGAPIHMVIVNYRIGDESALNFVQELRQYPTIQDTKIILIAPHRNASAAQIGRTKSFSASVSMPIHRAKLYEVVASVASRVLPSDTEEESFAQFQYWPPPVEEAAQAKALILVAEDNRTNQLVIKSQLQRLGFAAEFVNDGREAWEVLSKDVGRYGLLLTDCHMPFIDGYRLSGMIRDQEQLTGTRLPIVALTANALQGEADVCMAAGMDGYLSKPAELQALNNMILRWLPAAGSLRRTPEELISADPVTPSSPSPGPIQDGQKSAGADLAIDVGALGRLLGNDDEAYIRDMLTVFWETMEDTPRKLAKLMRDRDAAGVMGAAHAAKGAAASAAATPLAALLKDLQNAGSSENWAEIKTLMPKIEREFDNVQVFIKNLNQGQSANNTASDHRGIG